MAEGNAAQHLDQGWEGMNWVAADSEEEDFDDDPDHDVDTDADPDPALNPHPPADADAADPDPEDPYPPPADHFTSDEEEEIDESPPRNPFPNAGPPPPVVPKQHRGVQWNPKLHRPLFEGSPHSVIQTVFLLVSIKQKHNMSDAAFEDMLDANARLAQQPNLYPSSFFVCKSMLGVKPLKNCTWHTCGCQEQAWDPKGPSSPTDSCQHCGDLRYKKDRHGKLIPAQVGCCFTIVSELCVMFLDFILGPGPASTLQACNPMCRAFCQDHSLREASVTR